jgi:lipopolysaccharide export system protein LptC
MSAQLPLARATRRPRSLWQRTLDVWDRFSLYLPVLMMGVLALGTYWLVRNSPVFNAPAAAKEAMHESDYFMRKFTLKSFDDDGLLKSEVYGIEARHYPDTDTLEIDQPRIRSINPEGRLVTSTGNRALSNGDGSEVQLIGNARVVREATLDADGKELPKLEFKGEFLHAYVNDERVKSHLPVTLTRGGDQFTGDTFAYDSISGIADLKGHVRGLMVPRNAASARAVTPAGAAKPPAR